MDCVRSAPTCIVGGGGGGFEIRTIKKFTRIYRLKLLIEEPDNDSALNNPDTDDKCPHFAETENLTSSYQNVCHWFNHRK